MNEQLKSKVLIMIIGVLLAANIIMLSFFMLNGRKEKKEKIAKKNYVSEYLEKEVGFNAEQLGRYDSLSRRHREQIRATFNELSPDRKDIFRDLVTASFSDSAINNAAARLHEQQKVFELNMLMHLKEIRDICTEIQRPRFDTGFYKILVKRGDAHKEK